jgi:hypothetical protein
VTLRDLTPNQISPQAALVLDYLSGTGEDAKGNPTPRKLSPLIAHMTLGVASLTARIAELRRAGYDIEDRWDADHFMRRYKTYWMLGPGTRR